MWCSISQGNTFISLIVSTPQGIHQVFIILQITSEHYIITGVLFIIPNHLAPSISDISNVIMGNLSFLKFVEALGSIELLGKNHVLVVLNNFHEILVAKHVMNFAHILVPLVYIFPLQKWHALQQFGDWVQVKSTHPILKPKNYHEDLKSNEWEAWH